MLKSEDESVRRRWSEFVESTPAGVRESLLAVVKIVLTTLPDRLIPYARIPAAVEALEFS
jgi:hypothetical protein